MPRQPLSSSPSFQTAMVHLLKACYGLALVVILSASLGTVSSQGAELTSSPEYQVKAAFIYNFMKFVEWPADATSAPTTITLGILGRDPFGDALEPVKGKLAKGRKIVVVRYRRVEEVRDCDVLFIADSQRAHLPQILKAMQGQRVLTIADHEGFCQAGGMINLLSVKSKIVFEVNIAAANRARLRISSQLLKLARNVLE